MIHLERQSTPVGIGALKRELDSSIYYGEKYGLDVRKKIRFERSYLKLKQAAGKMMRKNPLEQESVRNSIQLIEEEYGEYLE